MAGTPRLSPEQWAATRRRWEGCDAPGFDWIAPEVAAAFGIPVTRQGVSVRAKRDGWKKGGNPSKPLAVVAQQAKPGASQRAAVAQQATTAVAAPIQGQIASREVAEETGLTPAEEEFALGIGKGLNQSDAYRSAFPKSVKWKPETVHEAASRLAAKHKVNARVQDLLTEAATKNGADITLVLKQYLSRLNADPRELTEVRVAPCRYCYGSSRRYQFTDGEMEDEHDRHEDKRLAKLDAGGADIGDFNEKGGGGYTVLKEPSPECPSCGGAGSSRVVLKDSRTFSPAALALFGGVKQTKEGIEVKLTDRVDVLGHVARHVGFFEADKDPAVSISMTVTELDAIYADAMEASKAGQRFAMGRMKRIAAKVPSRPIDADEVGDVG